MPRSLPALVLAAAAGAAVTYFFVAPPRPAALLPRTDDSQPDLPSAPARVAAAAGVAERAAVYTNAARADAAALSRQAREAAARPPSALRTFTLGVVLARYAELDPARATALGRELRVPADVLGALYATWATSDPARARAALADIDDPVAATTIGLAMFAALGSDETAMRQIAADLPSGAERGFIVGAIAAVAKLHPAIALDQALALTESGLSGLALQEIATEWARSDIAAALKAGDGIADPDLRAMFQNAVLREWAQFDLDAVFTYYLALDVESQEDLAALGALRDIARLDPYRALELSARLPAAVRVGVEQSALQSLAQRDPEAALQYISRLPPGQQQQVRQSLARAYGKQDPEAALAWARATGVRENLFGVLAGVAVTNPQLAFDVLATLPVADRSSAMQSLMNGARSDRGANFAALAEGMLALEGSFDASLGGRSTVAMLLGSWASRSPSAALEWTIANGERIPPAAFTNVSAAVAGNDLATAEQYLARVPAQARLAWIQGMAQTYAQTDPSAAAAWVEQFRAEPAYATAATVVAQSLARFDPPAAAAMLDRIDDSSSTDPQTLVMATRSVAMAWARKDAPAAADWARRIATDEQHPIEQRSMPLRAATEVWAGNDRAAARSWALRLPAGSARDAALGTLLATARTSGELDTTLLQAFSGDESRQRAMLSAIYRIAQGDPADARLLAERHLTTPERRQQAERTIGQIERQRTGSPAIFFSD
jgi:hypothetical protein